MNKDTTERFMTIEAIDIHTFACNGDETLLGITTTDINDYATHNVTLKFSTRDLLQSLDKEYMKEQLTKYIKGL